MEAMLSPILRRRKLGAQLRRLRTERGLTEEQVAECLVWSPSKMSRIETGHRGATSDDSPNCEAVSVLDYARFAPDDGLRGDHREGSRIGDESERDQLRARTLALSAVLDEAVLHRVIGGDAVMRAQLEQIIHAADLPNVTFQFVPFIAGAHPAMESNFNIYEFHERPGQGGVC
jgi:transcriptional regulator with XRE-family HTH domain